MPKLDIPPIGKNIPKYWSPKRRKSPIIVEENLAEGDHVEDENVEPAGNGNNNYHGGRNMGHQFME